MIWTPFMHPTLVDGDTFDHNPDMPPRNLTNVWSTPRLFKEDGCISALIYPSVWLIEASYPWDRRHFELIRGDLKDRWRSTRDWLRHVSRTNEVSSNASTFFQNSYFSLFLSPWCWQPSRTFCASCNEITINALCELSAWTKKIAHERFYSSPLLYLYFFLHPCTITHHLSLVRSCLLILGWYG